MVPLQIDETLTDSDDEYFGPAHVYRQINVDFTREPLRGGRCQQLAQLMLNSEPERKLFDDFEEGDPVGCVPVPNLNEEADSNINNK